MSHRYRSKGVKREHSIIAGLLPLLERIAAHPAVSGITPGRIEVTRGASPRLELRYGTPTISGMKLAARRGRTVQEVFIVTREPDVVMTFLRDSIAEFLA